MQRPHGLAILEVLIAFTIFLVVSILAVTALVTASRYQRRLLDSQELETECRAVMENITADLFESFLRFVNVEPGSIVFPSPRDADQRLTVDPVDGSLLWSKFWCYYHEPSEKRLYKKFEIRPSGPQPEKSWMLLPPRDRAYFLLNGQTSRVLSESVEDFQVTLLKPDPATGPRALQAATRDDATLIELQLHLEVLSDSKPVGIKFTSKVVPRN